MGSVSLLSDRDVLLDAAACLGQLCPKGQSAWQCPVPGCTRQDSDAEYLQSHILADHFDFVKAHAAVLSRLVQACQQLSGRCPFNNDHQLSCSQGEYRAHIARHHMTDAWALAQKLQRSYNYDSYPAYSGAAHKPTPQTATHTSHTPQGPHPDPRRYSDVRTQRDGRDQHSTTARGPSTTAQGGLDQGTLPPSGAPDTHGSKAQGQSAQKGVTSKARELRYPCPVGCSAPTMAPWQIPGHVLDAHLDLLLGWVQDQQRRDAGAYTTTHARCSSPQPGVASQKPWSALVADNASQPTAGLHAARPHTAQQPSVARSSSPRYGDAMVGAEAGQGVGASHTVLRLCRPWTAASAAYHTPTAGSPTGHTNAGQLPRPGTPDSVGLGGVQKKGAWGLGVTAVAVSPVSHVSSAIGPWAADPASPAASLGWSRDFDAARAAGGGGSPWSPRRGGSPGATQAAAAVVSEMSRAACVLSDVRSDLAGATRGLLSSPGPYGSAKLANAMQVASPKLKEVARHLSGLAISTAVQSPRGQPLTASVDAPSPAHDDAPASPMHDFLALSPSHADTRQWTQRLLAVASTVQELSGAAAAAATADASSPRAHAPPRVALPHDMRGDAAVTASYDADAAVLQVAVRQLQQRLGEQLEELMSLTSETAGCPSPQRPTHKTTAAAVNSNREPAVVINSALTAQTDTKSEPLSGAVSEQVQPQLPYRPDVGTVGSWSLQGVNYQGAKSDSVLRSIARTVLRAGVGVLSVQHLHSQTLASALQLQLQAEDTADSHGEWRLYVADSSPAPGPIDDTGINAGSSLARKRTEGKNYQAVLWRESAHTSTDSVGVKPWSGHTQGSFCALTETHGLFTHCPLYALVSVRGHTLLVISVTLASDSYTAAQEVRRLPLLAGAAALANPTLIAAPGVRNIGAPGSGTVPTVILTQTQTPSSHADTLSSVSSHDAASLQSAWAEVEAAGWRSAVCGPTLSRDLPPHQCGHVLLTQGVMPPGCFAGTYDCVPDAHAPVTQPTSYTKHTRTTNPSSVAAKEAMSPSDGPCQKLLWFQWWVPTATQPAATQPASTPRASVAAGAAAAVVKTFAIPDLARACYNAAGPASGGRGAGAAALAPAADALVAALAERYAAEQRVKARTQGVTLSPTNASWNVQAVRASPAMGPTHVPGSNPALNASWEEQVLAAAYASTPGSHRPSAAQTPAYADQGHMAGAAAGASAAAGAARALFQLSPGASPVALVPGDAHGSPAVSVRSDYQTPDFLTLAEALISNRDGAASAQASPAQGPQAATLLRQGASPPPAAAQPLNAWISPKRTSVSELSLPFPAEPAGSPSTSLGTAMAPNTKIGVPTGLAVSGHSSAAGPSTYAAGATTTASPPTRPPRALGSADGCVPRESHAPHGADGALGSRVSAGQGSERASSNGSVRASRVPTFSSPAAAAAAAAAMAREESLRSRASDSDAAISGRASAAAPTTHPYPHLTSATGVIGSLAAALSASSSSNSSDSVVSNGAAHEATSKPHVGAPQGSGPQGYSMQGGAKDAPGGQGTIGEGNSDDYITPKPSTTVQGTDAAHAMSPLTHLMQQVVIGTLVGSDSSNGSTSHSNSHRGAESPVSDSGSSSDITLPGVGTPVHTAKGQASQAAVAAAGRVVAQSPPEPFLAATGGTETTSQSLFGPSGVVTGGHAGDNGNDGDGESNPCTEDLHMVEEMLGNKTPVKQAQGTGVHGALNTDAGTGVSGMGGAEVGMTAVAGTGVTDTTMGNESNSTGAATPHDSDAEDDALLRELLGYSPAPRKPTPSTTGPTTAAPSASQAAGNTQQSGTAPQRAAGDAGVSGGRVQGSNGSVRPAVARQVPTEDVLVLSDEETDLGYTTQPQPQLQPQQSQPRPQTYAAAVRSDAKRTPAVSPAKPSGASAAPAIAAGAARQAPTSSHTPLTGSVVQDASDSFSDMLLRPDAFMASLATQREQQQQSRQQPFSQPQPSTVPPGSAPTQAASPSKGLDTRPPGVAQRGPMGVLAQGRQGQAVGPSQAVGGAKAVGLGRVVASKDEDVSLDLDDLDAFMDASPLGRL